MTEHILMIEDDESLAALIAEYLGTMGFKVTTRGTAAEGLALLPAETFDALILDVMLPDSDGFEVCRQVRARSDLPILMLTARGDETDRIVGLELGADDYLPKPFNPRELLARLRAILRRRGGAGVSSVRTAALWPSRDRSGCTDGAAGWPGPSAHELSIRSVVDARHQCRACDVTRRAHGQVARARGRSIRPQP